MFDLNSLWFILIAILWIGFFFLEGFDFGVGMLLPFLAKKDDERRTVINTIGPHWDGNEVWLLTAGGATFAAFPQWYATMFSGFYLAFFLLLLGLIVRGVAFEFRSKDLNPKWRTLWDWCIFVGSLVSSLLLGVAFANLVKGIPINENMIFTGNLLTLLNPYGLLGGLATIALFLLHGGIFLTLKTNGSFQIRAEAFTKKLWVPAVVLLLLLVVATFFYTDFLEHLGVISIFLPVLSLIALSMAGWFVFRKRNGWAFAMTALTIVLFQVTNFLILFPRVMISNTNPLFSLDIWNAASSPYTLKVMTIVAAIFVPIVIAYQAYTYWTFRKRVSVEKKDLVY